MLIYHLLTQITEEIVFIHLNYLLLYIQRGIGHRCIKPKGRRPISLENLAAGVRSAIIIRGGPMVYQGYSNEYPLFLAKSFIYIVYHIHMTQKIEILHNIIGFQTSSFLLSAEKS